MPPTQITSFPVRLSKTPTKFEYESRNEPLTMDMQWNDRTNPPKYLNATGANAAQLDDVSTGTSNVMTLRYQNVLYSLIEAQLCQPTHQSWILPATNQSTNVLDLVLTFSTQRLEAPYRYIILVQPILAAQSGTIPRYLQGLSNSSESGPFSLRNFFPSGTAMFAYYVTELLPELGRTQKEYANVFVGVDGLQVSESFLTQFRTSLGQAGYPPFSGLPMQSRLSTTINTIDLNKILTTTILLDYANAQASFKDPSKIVREDTLDSYKCVPFDPDRNIVENADGQSIIRVDPTTGQILSDVVKARDTTRAAEGTVGKMDPGRLRDYLSSALGIILSILFFGGLLYIGITWFQGRRASAAPIPSYGLGSGVSAPPAPESKWQLLPIGLLVLSIGGFIGFIVGAMLS